MVSEPINDVEKKNKKPVRKYKLTSEAGRKRLDDVSASADQNEFLFFVEYMPATIEVLELDYATKMCLE